MSFYVIVLSGRKCLDSCIVMVFSMSVISVVSMMLMISVSYGDMLYCVVRNVVVYVLMLMNVVCLKFVILLMFVSSMSLIVMIVYRLM